ncbi:MAG: hypothetical protein QME06_03625, partial [Desulfobacterales bacterium]|nr:hypothetical protein [Desulfobacterales bacterium]
MKARTIMSIIAIIIFTCATAVAVENQGAKDIALDGGKKGNVDFPHHLHQNATGSCNACHDLFPKTARLTGMECLKMECCNACHDLFPKTAGTIKDFK